MFQPTIALAKIRMGSRTLTIGQVERLEVANKYQTATGSWKIEGNACRISARSTKSCEITAIREGSCTVIWTGVIDAGWYDDYYWDITVEEVPIPDPTVAVINETNFPNDDFRLYLKNRFGDTLTESEVNETTKIEVNDVWLLNLKGIEYFKYLKELNCFWNRIAKGGLDLSKNTALQRLSLVKCQLSSLDVSNNKSLTYLDCSLNNIKGSEMDALINSLPDNEVSDEHYFNTFVVFEDSEEEGNECTAIQLENAKAKGWQPCRRIDGYLHKITTGIRDIQYEKTQKVSIFNLNGQRIDKPFKGINIIDGKKILIK